MTNYERIKNMTLDEMHEFFIEMGSKHIVFSRVFELPKGTDTSGLSYNDEIKVWLNSEYDFRGGDS
jgi:hypothetical protein